ncbi:DUF4334 domain-containing protein [Nocardia stercoris]|uniref:DUF4334 domain-containing protein n=1 Tax=Nocardia stercoris TaxID=2483361 RepID=A0A3M2L7B7_9NOCA|nr:DUF4334 domain-containing protein [Nocardia stercoris]RMI33427.1 DUF4334 domain-containing protein [Nocardia stercoris]
MRVSATGLESTVSDNPARTAFSELKKRARQRLVTGPEHFLIPDADLDEFWATLEPATVDFMIGAWEGGEFDTGHRENGTLALINWFGKTFNSATDVQPLVCLDADGNRYSNTDNGEGSLWMEEFRGEVTATMVFDEQPVHDHFKKIDDDAVMGIMDGKNALDNGRYAYFYLERVHAAYS